MLSHLNTKNANYLFIMSVLKEILSLGSITQKEYLRAKKYYRKLTGADIVSRHVNGRSRIRNMRSFSQGKPPLPAAPAMRPAQELREELQGRIEDTAAGHDRRCALHDNHPAVRVQHALPF